MVTQPGHICPNDEELFPQQSGDIAHSDTHRPPVPASVAASPARGREEGREAGSGGAAALTKDGGRGRPGTSVALKPFPPIPARHVIAGGCGRRCPAPAGQSQAGGERWRGELEPSSVEPSRAGQSRAGHAPGRSGGAGRSGPERAARSGWQQRDGARGGRGSHPTAEGAPARHG